MHVRITILIVNLTNLLVELQDALILKLVIMIFMLFMDFE